MLDAVPGACGSLVQKVPCVVCHPARACMTHAHCVCDSMNADRSGHTSEPVDRVGLDCFSSPGGTCLAGGLTGEEEAGEAPRAEPLRSPGWACSGDRPAWPQQVGSCVRDLSSGVGLGYYLRVMGALGVLSADGMWPCLHFSRSSLAGCLWSRVQTGTGEASKTRGWSGGCHAGVEGWVLVVSWREVLQSLGLDREDPRGLLGGCGLQGDEPLSGSPRTT